MSFHGESNQRQKNNLERNRTRISNFFFKTYFMVFELSIAHKIFSKICYSLTSCHQICFKNMQRNSMYLKVGKKRLFRSVFTSLVFIVSFHHICKFIDFQNEKHPQRITIQTSVHTERETRRKEISLLLLHFIRSKSLCKKYHFLIYTKKEN